jgi:predicted metal-dependent peptidase
MSSRAESLAKATKELMISEPFYGLFLLQLNKSWSDKVPTAGVSLNGINYNLDLNPDFWDSLKDNEQPGLLKHELLHVVKGHLTSFSGLNQINRDIANIAMDVEINQYIDKSMIPPGALLPSSFPTLKLKDKQGTHYYFQELMVHAQKNTSKALKSLMDAIAKGEKEADGEGGEKLKVPQHAWDAFNEMDSATQKLVEAQLEHQMRTAVEAVQKARGTVPGEIAEILKALEPEAPKFDWRGFVRRFAGGSYKIYTKKLRRKYNKRYEEDAGLKIKQRKHILVAIDTSGSVSTEELVEFFKEVDHISRTGSDVTIVQCDAAISNIASYKRGMDIKIHGRGGTSFDPVVDYYNENLRKYTCLIYFTDGEAPSPDKSPGKVLWVISSKSRMNNDLPGYRIQLN